MTRLFSFRFDVDTHRCMREGVPALSALGRRLDAPFTFFVNMGRAVSRRGMARRLVTGGPSPGVAAKLSAREKLGSRGYVEAAILNPPVGGASQDILRAVVSEGHEVGLHGGRNHAVWQSEALGWGRDRVAREVDAVLPSLAAAVGGTPAGFASPGWVSPPSLPEVLAERGFRYLADTHGPGGTPAVEGDVAAMGPEASPVASAGAGSSGLPNVRTALTGEPGGVAYLEHLRALGLDDAQAERRFLGDLQAAGRVAVVYDHPYWAGIRDLELVERMVELARGEGYRVVPLEVLASGGHR